MEAWPEALEPVHLKRRYPRLGVHYRRNAGAVENHGVNLCIMADPTINADASGLKLAWVVAGIAVGVVLLSFVLYLLD